LCVFSLLTNLLAGTHGTGESTISALVGGLWWKAGNYGTVEISTADEHIFSKYPIVS
jgi:hypothetical protein